MLDHTALKFNQASIVTLLLLAFAFNWMWMVAFVGAVMLVGTVWPNAGLFKLIYVRLLKPFGLLKPDLHLDKPHPHLFAQGLGGLFLALATAAFVSGATLWGWLLTAIVVVLAAINLFAGFCLGCFFYFQLVRRGINLSLPFWRAAK
jgi:hypothetical protein